jgi:hypothetical protein
MRLFGLRATLAVAAFCAWSTTSAHGGDAPPWTIPNDANFALNNPDLYAWVTFIALNWPADLETKTADASQELGADGPVVWETWAERSEVFLPGAADPGPWGDLGASGTRPGTFERPTQQQLIFAAEPIPPGHTDAQNHEIRINKPTFDYIVANDLYAIEGQQAMFYAGTPFNFPQDSISVKAVWRPIAEEDKPRYKWNIFTHEDGTETLYGLTGFHINTAVLSNWFWATFEHEDNPYRRGVFDEGWMLPSVDSVACPDRPVGCMNAPSRLGLEGTVWEHYRLRGTMTDYVDDNGVPIVLTNSEIETGMQTTSSCMTCHARSTVGPNKNLAMEYKFGPDADKHPPAPPTVMRIEINTYDEDGRVIGHVGVPQNDWYALPDTGAYAWPGYMRMDFLYSLYSADYRNPGNPEED